MVEYMLIIENGKKAADELNRLAKAGWRVVGCAHQNGLLGLTYVLERPARG